MKITSGGKTVKLISVRFFLPGKAVTELGLYYQELVAVYVAWNEKRMKSGGRCILGTIMVGNVSLPPYRENKGYRVAMIAEFCGQVCLDHGDIYTTPEVAREELAMLATAFDAEIAQSGLGSVLRSEITAGFCVWPRDIDGKLGQMKSAA